MGDYGLFAEQLTTGHGYATGNCVWVRSLKNLFAEQGVSAAFSHSEHDQANPSVSVKLLAEGREADLVVWESGEGVFETVGNVLLGDGDVLDQHCFRRWNGEYFDECSTPCPARWSQQVTSDCTASERSMMTSVMRSGLNAFPTDA